METGIEKFDPSTLVSLIPDEAWDQMLEKEIYIFTTGRIVHHHETDFKHKDENGNYLRLDWDEKIPYSQLPQKDKWGHPTGKDDISPLQQMIREELTKKFREDLVKYLNGEQYIATRDQYGITAISKAVEEIMVKHSADIFRSIIGEFMQRGFENMRTQVAMQSGQY